MSTSEGIRTSDTDSMMVNRLEIPAISPDMSQFSNKTMNRLLSVMTRRNSAMSRCLYEVIRGNSVFILRGHPKNARHDSLVFFKPDRIEFYDGNNLFVTVYFPHQEGFWGINEVLTEIFSTFSQNNIDVLEKTTTITNLFTDFETGGTDCHGYPQQSLFQDEVGNFFGHPYKTKKAEYIPEEAEYIKGKTEYACDDIYDIFDRGDVYRREVVAYIKNK